MQSCQSHSQADAIQLSPQVYRDSIARFNNIQVIDIRTPKEFDSNHIGKAININFFSEKFADSVGLLDTKQPVFIYCRSGKRSAKSISIFKEAGFKKIYDLEGGFLNWKSKDLPTESK